MHTDGEYGVFEIHVPALINGLFAAAALLISFGAVIGKISPSQLVFMAMVLYSILYWYLKELVLIFLIFFAG